MVAMTPLIAIQILGLVYKIKQAATPAQSVEGEQSEVIELQGGDATVEVDSTLENNDDDIIDF